MKIDIAWTPEQPPLDVLIQMVNLQLDDARDSLKKNSKVPIDHSARLLHNTGNETTH